jgi:hypothetical protein
MNLFLRRVVHPQATDNFRIIFKDSDGTDFEIFVFSSSQRSAVEGH